MIKLNNLLCMAFLFIIATSSSVYAQSPGNIGTTNLTAWFNPDNLATGAATSWQSTYPAGVSALTLYDASAPYPTVTNTPLNSTSNYNKTISFIGNSTTSVMSLEMPGTINLLDNALSTSQGTLFAVYFTDQNTNAQHVVDYRESAGDAIQVRRLSGTLSRIALGTSNSTNATRDYAGDDKPIIVSYSGNKATTTSMKFRVKSLEWNNNPTSSSAGTGGQLGLTIGARKNTAGVYSGVNQSYISEIIFFKTNLSLSDNIKVESYLGIKYGITLDPTGVSLGKYVASNNSSLWDASGVLNYQTDVIGIGRDDNTLLNQKQSHSFDDSTRIYLGTLASNIAANTSVFTSDISYVLAGHDAGISQESALASLEIPPAQNILGRIEREWRVTNTNMSDSYNMDITLKSFANFTSNPAELCLLVDDDGNFTDASVYQAGLTFSVNGNTISVSGISNLQIPSNSTKYITLAYKNNIVASPVLTAKFFIQGYYAGSATNHSVLLNEGVAGALPTETDSVTVDLMNSSTPYNMLYSITGKLLTNGTITCTYPVAALGNSYYVKVTHRNALQTWSAVPVILLTNTSYDFSVAANKAFEDNQIEVDPGVFAFYSGDIVQDENIDLIDATMIEYDIYLFQYGYFVTDINGDGNVDLLDAPIVESNINNFVFSSHP